MIELNTINAERYTHELLSREYRKDTRWTIGTATVKEYENGTPSLITVPFTLYAGNQGPIEYTMDVWAEPCLNGQLYGEF